MIALAIIIFLPGQPPRSVQMGTMTSAEACNVAGRGAASVFSETMPEAVIMWTCAPMGMGA